MGSSGRERMRGKEGGRERASSVSGIFLLLILVYGTGEEWRREGRSDGRRGHSEEEGEEIGRE